MLIEAHDCTRGQIQGKENLIKKKRSKGKKSFLEKIKDTFSFYILFNL